MLLEYSKVKELMKAIKKKPFLSEIDVRVIHRVQDAYWDKIVMSFDEFAIYCLVYSCPLFPDVIRQVDDWILEIKWELRIIDSGLVAYSTTPSIELFNWRTNNLADILGEVELITSSLGIVELEREEVEELVSTPTIRDLTLNAFNKYLWGMSIFGELEFGSEGIFELVMGSLTLRISEHRKLYIKSRGEAFFLKDISKEATNVKNNL